MRDAGTIGTIAAQAIARRVEAAVARPPECGKCGTPASGNRTGWWCGECCIPVRSERA